MTRRNKMVIIPNSFCCLPMIILFLMIIMTITSPTLAFQNLVEAKASEVINSTTFVETKGHQFLLKGKPLFLNGFNAYWLMNYGADPSSRTKVTQLLQQASKFGMNLARTWAFNDGDYKPLQISPGIYDEQVFKGLDFVVAEAEKYGVYLILSLVNNFRDYGGKERYVEWAKQQGQQLTNEDDFYTNDLVKNFYKNHIKAVITRVNSITGKMYKNDATIFAWELMNEPRCPTSPSGTHLQSWAQEMVAHVKSIDPNHLLEIGLEGFYGESDAVRKQNNPNSYPVGTDFISNNQIPQVDFATIHFYPEAWLPTTNQSDEAQWAFVGNWIQAHIQDCSLVLKKPLVIGEFGRSSKQPDFTMEKRNQYFEAVYTDIYNSARNGGPLVGGLFWQLLGLGMDNMGDGYQLILEQDSSTASLIAQQSQRLRSIT